ncbi:hypothetical protein [Streptosporangium sp. NPDC049644]|uniref:hypothetical protein n=1 Tax=Streptosporangium sp. NPDC049644 TaxID=3155507 RepID=UPI00343F2B57
MPAREAGPAPLLVIGYVLAVFAIAGWPATATAIGIPIAAVLFRRTGTTGHAGVQVGEHTAWPVVLRRGRTRG